MEFHLDYETFSEADLQSVGVDVYSKHPSTRVLIAAWSFDDEVHSWDESQGAIKAFTDALHKAVKNPNCTFWAHNATFERKISKHVLGIDIPIQRWKDTMVLAHTLSMPGNLGTIGQIVRLPSELQKDKRGTDLIKLFSMPQKLAKNRRSDGFIRLRGFKTDPDAWAEFVAYCKQDVVAEKALHRRFRAYDMPPHEWDVWYLDQEINELGYPIDRQLCRTAIPAYKAIQQVYLSQVRAVTGVKNPGSPAQISAWVRERGYDRPDLRKDTVKKALRSDSLDDDVRTVLELRLKAASSSPKKYKAIDQATAEDDRIRYTMQFAGAGRTWRWAGRIAQFQNIPRPSKAFENLDYMARAIEDIKIGCPDMLWALYKDPMDTIVSLIRPVIRAQSGNTLSIADLSSIENVVLGWLARCSVTLQEFRDGKDPYLAFAVYLFGLSYDELWYEYSTSKKKDKRTLSKPAKLGAGYRLGGGDQNNDGSKTGLWGYAENLGVEMTREEAHRGVEIYREAYPKIVQFWYDLDNAAKAVIEGEKKTARVGFIEFDRAGPFMRIKLPSGRYLHYLRPKIESRKAPWGAVKPTITYAGLNQTSGKWQRLSTHGGKLTENVTQAVARDILAEGMIRMKATGRLPIVGHVHDETICEVPKKDAKELLALQIACMTVAPDWAPDIPLNAAGFTSDFYTKD